LRLLAQKLQRQCPVNELFEALYRLVTLGVDAAKRTAIGQVLPRIQLGDKGFAVRVTFSPLPGGLLGGEIRRSASTMTSCCRSWASATTPGSTTGAGAT
jgi:hypothetical protein